MFTIGISVTHIKIAVKNTNFKFKFFISKLSKKLLQAQVQKLYTSDLLSFLDWL